MYSSLMIKASFFFFFCSQVGSSYLVRSIVVILFISERFRISVTVTQIFMNTYAFTHVRMKACICVCVYLLCTCVCFIHITWANRFLTLPFYWGHGSKRDFKRVFLSWNTLLGHLYTRLCVYIYLFCNSDKKIHSNELDYIQLKIKIQTNIL